MKILVFSNGDFQEGNGANSRFTCYAKGFFELGVSIEFHIVLPTEFNGQGINNSVLGRYDKVKYNYLTGKTQRRRTLLGRVLSLFISWINALKIIKKNHRNSICYFYGPQFFSFAPILWAAKLFGRTIIIEQTELHSIAQKEERSGFGYLANLGHVIVEQHMESLCDGLVTISRRLELFYKRKFKGLPIAKIPIVVDPSRFDISGSNEEIVTRKNILGYLGSFGIKDGVDGILNAFSAIIKNGSKYKLKLIGYQPNYFSLESKLAEYGIPEASVISTGLVKKNEIPQHLADCDTLILNRTSDAYSHYGFATKLGEYLLSGVPVISTNVSDVGRFLNEEEIMLVDADNSNILVGAINMRYANYQKYNEMGLNGRVAGIREFDYKKWVPELCAFLQAVNNKKGQA